MVLPETGVVRIGGGVQQDVRVGMSVGADLRGDTYAAEDARAPRHQGVDVVTETDTERRRGGHGSCSRGFRPEREARA